MPELTSIHIIILCIVAITAAALNVTKLVKMIKDWNKED